MVFKILYNNNNMIREIILRKRNINNEFFLILTIWLFVFFFFFFLVFSPSIFVHKKSQLIIAYIISMIILSWLLFLITNIKISKEIIYRNALKRLRMGEKFYLTINKKEMSFPYFLRIEITNPVKEDVDTTSIIPLKDIVNTVVWQNEINGKMELIILRKKDSSENITKYIFNQNFFRDSLKIILNELFNNTISIYFIKSKKDYDDGILKDICENRLIQNIQLKRIKDIDEINSFV